MKTYLVTGGFGFLGSDLVRILIARGDCVRVLDNASRGTPLSLQNLDCKKGQLEIMDADIRDPQKVRTAVNGVDCVCHLAYINGTEFFYSRPAEVLDVGVKGMVNVLDACITENVGELLLLSSSEVYQTPSRVPTDETTPLSVPDPFNPRYSYGGGKIISELMAIHYGRQYFNRVVIVRPHNVFGPKMGKEHVIPQFIERLLQLKNKRTENKVLLPIQGDGSQTRSFIFIDDFTEGLRCILEKGSHLNIYHVGTMEEQTIADVAKKVGLCLGLEVEVVAGEETPGGTKRRCPDIYKLKSLGFSPRFSFMQGLSKTVEGYLS